MKKIDIIKPNFKFLGQKIGCPTDESINQNTSCG